MRHLIDTVAGLHDRGVQFRSLRENIDTTTASGKLTFHLFAAFAEFERDLPRERTAAGLAAIAGCRTGRAGGRPRKIPPRRSQTTAGAVSTPLTSNAGSSASVGRYDQQPAALTTQVAGAYAPEQNRRDTRRAGR